MSVNTIALFQGVSTPLSDLQAKITELGWELGKISFDKKLNAFIAEASSPHGERVSKSGPNESTAVANLLLAVSRRQYRRSAALYQLGFCHLGFTDKIREIAEAYAKAPIYDPKAIRAYKLLADDSVHRAEVLGRQLQIEYTNEPDPYLSHTDLIKDVHEKRRYRASQAMTAHPAWTPDQVVAYRIVHDVLGHGVSGGAFDWNGENAAAAAHMALLSPLAQQALFTEAIARPAYMSVYGQGPHKIALFPEFMGEHEEKGFQDGIHPSQVVAPVALPTFKRASGRKLDPNHGWTSGIEPMEPNAFIHHGDPLEGQAVKDNAALVDTNWFNEPLPLQRQAIVNAFRVVLLSPRKDLRWNAIHYQDIATVPAEVDDPRIYWDTLEKSRRKWNEAQGIAPDAHMPYFKFLAPFSAIIQAKILAKHAHGKLVVPKGKTVHEHAADVARTILFRWWTEEQERIEAEDAHKPSNKQRGTDEIERRANEALGRRLKQYIKASDPETDHERTEKPMALFARTADLDSKPNPKHKLGWTPGNIGKAMILRDHSVHTWNTSTTDSGGTTYNKEDGYPFHEDYIDQIWGGRENMPSKVEQFFFIAPDGKATVSSAYSDAVQAADPRIQPGGSRWNFESKLAGDGMRHWKGVTLIDGTERKWHSSEGTHLDNMEREGISPKVVTDYWYEDDEGERYDLNNYKDFYFKNFDINNVPKQGAKAVPAEQQNLLTGQDSLKYGAFMGSHLKYISAVSRHVDEILQAALEDIHQHDGTGFHFRQKVLELDLPGVGPKVCSFAWLLLAPRTSQLATVDTHIMDVLGHDYNKEMNDRDYYKFERELAAGRDASGYGHIPLGAFQWGIWDFKRTGPGSHQDHSAMRVLDPVHHLDVDWASKSPLLKGSDWASQAPDWWKATQEHRDAVAKEWDETFGKEFPRDADPYQLIDEEHISKIAYGETFSDWWEKETPIKSYDVDRKSKRLAEYAAATKKTKAQVEDWLDDHKEDTRLSDSDFKRFRKKLLDKFNRINKHGSASQLSPWFHHEEQEHRGQPGQTIMRHILDTTGLMDPRHVWELFEDDRVGKD